MSGIRVAAIVLLAAWLGACQSDLDRRYLDAELDRRLELPPDLIEPDTEAAYALPEVFYRGPADDGKGPPTLVNVKSMRLEGSGNFYWLDVGDPVARLYPIARAFWAEEGYSLDMDEPAIGMMRTDWTFSEQGQPTGGFFKWLLGDRDVVKSQDQFTTRFERDGAGGSRIFIAHRGSVATWVKPAAQSPQTDLAFDVRAWTFRQSQPEREIEMLSRLMLFLGMEQAGVERQRARAALFAPRATIDFGNEQSAPLLRLKDPYQIAWNRLYHQLERMDFAIIEATFERGLDGRGSIVVEIELDDTGEEDDGGFFSWFSTSDPSPRAHRLELQIQPEDNQWTRVAIRSSGADEVARKRRDEFAQLLHSQVR